jgi:hypothetical protein
MASIEEVYQPVTHKHDNCPICHNPALIQDIPLPRNSFDRLMISIRNTNAWFLIMQGKRIEVKEQINAK